MSAMLSYLGWYVLEYGYPLHPSPAHVAWCFGVGMFRAIAEDHAKRGIPWP